MIPGADYRRNDRCSSTRHADQNDGDKLDEKTAKTGTLACTVATVEPFGDGKLAHVTCAASPSPGFITDGDVSSWFAMTAAGLWRFDGDPSSVKGRPSTPAELKPAAMALAATPVAETRTSPDSADDDGRSITVTQGPGGAWCTELLDAGPGGANGHAFCLTPGVGLTSGSVLVDGGSEVSYELAYTLAVAGAEVRLDCSKPLPADADAAAAVWCYEVDNADLGRLATLPKLTSLSFSKQGLTDTGLATVATLTGLTSLNLVYTAVTDVGLAHVSKLVKLTSLDLTGTAISDAGLAHLATLPQLASLDLTATNVTDAGVAGLARPGLTIKR